VSGGDPGAACATARWIHLTEPTEPLNPPITLARTQRGYRELDLKIALCIGRGFTRAETADFAGCYIDTVDDRKHKNKDFIEQWAEYQRALDEFCAKKDAEVTKANLVTRWEKLLHKVERIYTRAIDKGLADDADGKDLKLAFNAAKQISDRVLGLPTQKIESESKHTEVRELGPATVQMLTLLESRLQARSLITAPEPDVIDVTDDSDGA
jgi:hypothetical protein